MSDLTELERIQSAIESMPDAFKCLPVSLLFELIPKQRDRIKELEAALKPFAIYACEPQLSCECHNCTAKNLLGG